MNASSVFKKSNGSAVQTSSMTYRRDANDVRAYAVALTPAGDRLREGAFELLLAAKRGS